MLNVCTGKWLTVTHRSFSHTSGFEDSFDSDLELVHVIQSIEDTENVHAVLLSLLTEVVNRIIRERGVRYTIRTSKQHLERDVRDQLRMATSNVAPPQHSRAQALLRA